MEDGDIPTPRPLRISKDRTKTSTRGTSSVPSIPRRCSSMTSARQVKARVPRQTGPRDKINVAKQRARNSNASNGLEHTHSIFTGLPPPILQYPGSTPSLAEASSPHGDTLEKSQSARSSADETSLHSKHDSTGSPLISFPKRTMPIGPRQFMRQLSTRYPRMGSGIHVRPKIPSSQSYIGRRVRGASLAENIPVPPQKLEDSLSVRFAGIPPYPLGKPSTPPITTPKVRIIPEIQAVSVTESKTAWIAVEVSGHVGIEDTCNGTHGLDVIVIIDDLDIASPQSFEDSCNAAQLLASCLNVESDRLGMISTSERLLMPLRRINLTSVRNALKTITRPLSGAEKHERNPLDTWKFAVSLITSAESRRQSTVGHIFVISHLAKTYTPFPTLEVIQTHILGTGPFGTSSCFHSGGWTFDSDILGLDNGGLAQQLCQTIRHFRKKINPGYLNDVEIHLHPGVGCSIEGVLGPSHCQVMGPGQSMELLVKMDVGSKTEPWVYDVLAYRDISDDSTTLVSTPAAADDRLRREGRPSSEELLAELDYLLHEGNVEILAVEIKYRHSLLPDDTVCQMSQACLLEKISAWRSSVGSELSQCPKKAKDVQKRLMKSIAENCEPERGLQILEGLYARDGSKSLCPDSAQLIMEELKSSHPSGANEHRDTTEEVETDLIHGESPTILDDITNHARRGSSVSTCSSISRSTSVVRTLRPECSWVTTSATNTDRDDSRYREDSSDAESDTWHSTVATMPMSDMEAIATERAIDELAKKVPATDPARMIWGKIRMMNTDGNRLRKENKYGVVGSNKTEARILEKARRNQRSLGEETLKSLRVKLGNGEQSVVNLVRDTEEVSSPWL